MKNLLSVSFALLIGSVMLAQTVITGTVKDKTGEPIPGANIQFVGKSIGTTADFDGNFELKVGQAPPFSIEVSLIGFSNVVIEITENGQHVLFL